jgi:hypothetical protein
MTDDQKKALSLALDYAFSAGKREPEKGSSEREAVLRALNRTAWPKDGFAKLAHEIVYRAIAQEWPEA